MNNDGIQLNCRLRDMNSGDSGDDDNNKNNTNG
jgi:hypothetical protein